MRVRDFAKVAGIDTATAAAEVQKVAGLDAPPHSNATIDEATIAKLQEKFPQLASADKTDGPVEEGATATDAAAPVAPAAPAVPAAPVAPAATESPAVAPASPPIPPAPPAPRPPTSPLNVVPQSEAPKDNSDPTSRAQVARDAVARQYESNPVPPKKRFEVSYPGADAAIVEAFDENEAWAKYNDANKRSWAPRLRTVIELTPEMEAARRSEAAKAAAAAAIASQPAVIK